VDEHDEKEGEEDNDFML